MSSGFVARVTPIHRTVVRPMPVRAERYPTVNALPTFMILVQKTWAPRKMSGPPTVAASRP